MNPSDRQLAQTLADDYAKAHSDCRRIVPIGAGGSGIVFHLRLQSGEDRALKVFRPDQIGQPTLRQGFIEEGRRLCEMQHPNVVRGFASAEQHFPSISRRLPYFLMEYFPHGTLEDLLLKSPRRRPSMAQVLALLEQALHALAYMHSLSPPLCHLDVKEANLLIDARVPHALRLKLSDLGVAKEVSAKSDSTEVRGSLLYWPEEWQRRLIGTLPSNVNRATIRLPRNEIPPSVDLHMLSVTFKRVFETVPEPDQELYSWRAGYLLLERLNWDWRDNTSEREKIADSAVALRDVSRIHAPRSLPSPMDEPSALQLPVSPITSCSTALRKLIDNPWLRRLSMVKELGVAHLVYPGAQHTRFEHTLGAYQHAVAYIHALLTNQNTPWFTTFFSDEEVKALALTVLFHDLGHYPFAHQLEDAPEWPSHEKLSYQILSGDLTTEHPELAAMVGPPRHLLDIVDKYWRVDPKLLLRFFRYCYRDELGGGPGRSPTPAPRSWRAASQVVNGPIDADKYDYIRRDAIHCGVPYGADRGVARFLSSLTVALGEDGATLAVTEKGRVEAEYVPVSRYAMFSEVYWHHTVRSLSTMLRRGLGAALRWDGRRVPLTLVELLTSSDERLLFNLRARATRARDRSVADLLTLVEARRPYVRVITLTQGHGLYRALADRQRDIIAGERFKEDAELVSEHFGITNLRPHELLWDIPKPGKDRLADVPIADLQGKVLAPHPGHLWKSLSGNFEQWVRKIRLFVHPDRRPEFLAPKRRRDREERFLDALGQQIGV